MRVLLTGAAGFLGSHLCERLLADGHSVIGIDNLVTGRRANLAHLERHPALRVIDADVVHGALPEVEALDAILHFASAASPPAYLRVPIETLLAGSVGTHRLLELARSHGARFLLASTSEVYGDPLVDPQPEGYWGNVNPVGPRSCYDEAKRFAEAMTMAFHREHRVATRIVRIFNTYGPRMRPDDGRVVSNFVVQALRGEPLTIYGDGQQTRSFCFVTDLVEGIVRLLEVDAPEPVNLGNPGEFTMLELAERVLAHTGSASVIERHPLPVDDPHQRRPDISRARALLGWEPVVPLDEGLRRTIAHFRSELGLS
ncbi:MAG: UDP-glucuronic acid decarboxylase family protein [Gemmatimonadales bacterium]|nr:UDP-glucuronic acid decarboxylase family protein [Gemmatimonadales bacterium]